MSTLASHAVLVSSVYVPVFLSVLLFYPDLFAARPSLRFLLALVPFWWAYLAARAYIRLAERSSTLHHPLGCLAHCAVWVFHSVVVLYHAVFITTYTLATYLATIFCLGIVVLEEWFFHNIITMHASDTAHLGTYEKMRTMYARGLIIWVKLWYLIDLRAPLETEDRKLVLSRSVTL